MSSHSSASNPSDSGFRYSRLRVLIISRIATRRADIRKCLETEPALEIQMVELESASDLGRLTHEESWDIVLLDTTLQDIRVLRARFDQAAIVFLEEDHGRNTDDAIFAGATDHFRFSQNEIDRESLWSLLRQTIRYHAIRKQHLHLTRLLEQRSKQVVNLSQKLWRSSPFDFRTGWFSHAQIVDRCQEEIGRAIRYGLPLSLVLVDVVNLPSIETEMGGDLVGQTLTELSVRTKTITRQSDIVGHYGLESFLFLLTNTTYEGAREFCDRLRTMLDMELSIDDEPIKIEWYMALVSRQEGCTYSPTDLLNHLERRIDRARESNCPGILVAE